jgi:hypothetical protein
MDNLHALQLDRDAVQLTRKALFMVDRMTTAEVDEVFKLAVIDYLRAEDKMDEIKADLENDSTRFYEKCHAWYGKSLDISLEFFEALVSRLSWCDAD